MRVAAVYDIHGNLPALEAVLEEVRRARVDLVVVGGDVVPGPMPRETLALLRDLDLPARFLHGNGDREVFLWRARARKRVPSRKRTGRACAGWPGSSSRRTSGGSRAGRRP